MLQKQHRDTAKRSVVKFFVSGGKIGDELAPFFTQCDEEEDRPAQTISEFGRLFSLNVYG